MSDVMSDVSIIFSVFSFQSSVVSCQCQSQHQHQHQHCQLSARVYSCSPCHMPTIHHAVAVTSCHCSRQTSPSTHHRHSRVTAAVLRSWYGRVLTDWQADPVMTGTQRSNQRPNQRLLRSFLRPTQGYSTARSRGSGLSLHCLRPLVT